ncbi:HNH endonuclease [Klebsiella pneumoniae]|uniref:HNH endonuclease n=1 Tax=Klebsiella pneumoniae TaxID=573 RepID=UPI0021BDFB58|nr:HNH endonuclease [Klebsiella pneumoniae]MCT8857156.1 HNH endonuclease [Klebsiella pneumoniae]
MSSLTHHRLQEVLHYSPDTGVFTWQLSNSNRVRVGGTAGSPNSGGYILIWVDRKSYPAHRLAWFYVNGKWPENEIDHINGVKFDNRICNLRQATHAENCRNRSMKKNNTSGVKGVSREGRLNKWRAECMVNGKQHRLGLFSSLTEADKAVRQFREIHHGDFANHGVGVEGKDHA